MTITEVSKKFGMSPDTLRYYEKIGLIEKIHRNSGGKREYQESDLNRIEFIRCMRSAGLSIEFLGQYLQLFNDGDESIAQRKEILVEQREILREKLENMQQTLNKLDHKIQNYDSVLIKKEQEIATAIKN